MMMGTDFGPLCYCSKEKLIHSPSAVAAHVRALAVGELLLTRVGCLIAREALIRSIVLID